MSEPDSDLVTISRTAYNRLMTIKKVTESHLGVDRLAFLQSQGGEVIWHEAPNTAVIDMDVVRSTGFTRAIHRGVGDATAVKIELQILHNALIQEAIKYGSSVHSFVGDSQQHLINIFTPHPVPAAAALAIGYNFQRRIATFRTQGVSELEARIAASSGTVNLTTIGSTERAALVALGTPIKSAEYLQSKTRVGTFVVSPGLYGELTPSTVTGNWIPIDATKPGFNVFQPTKVEEHDLSNLVRPHPSVINADITDSNVKLLKSDYEQLKNIEAVAKRYIGKVKLDSLIRHGAIFQGEVIPGSILYIGLSGITLTPENRERLNLIHSQIISLIYGLGGEVDKITQNTQVAYFGLYDTHGDHANRAVAAALAIKQRIAELRKELGIDFRVKLGIASGDVTLDNIGNEVRSEITSSGNPIIDSARLMAADNQYRILASTTTYELLDQKFRFSDVIPVEGKTKQESGLTAYSPSERKLRPGRVNIFGRDSLQFTLQERYHLVKDGNAACLLLEGDEGVGKTALLNNFRLDLEESEGINPIHFVWDTQKRTLPFGLITELFKHIYSISDNDIKSKSLSLADRIAVHSREIGLDNQTIKNAIRVASYLFEIHFDGYKEFESAEEARDIINDTFTHVINSEAAFNKSPYVLLLDNANLLDNYSRESLSYVCNNLAGKIMVLIAQRPTPTKFASDKIEALAKLGKLDMDSLRRIITITLGDEYIIKLDSADLEEIVEQSEGNPGHTKEIALRIKQYLSKHPNLDKLPSEEIKRLPPKIFDIVLDRIRSLDEHLYDYLCVAAVATAGHNYFYHEDIIPYVTRVPTEADLKLLEELNIIRRSRARTYEFVNSRIPEALRATIPSDKKDKDKAGRKEELHEAFADSLAARYKGKEEDVVDKIAWHLANARYSRRAEALPLLERAAKKKLGLSANEAAAELERNAIQIMYDLLGATDGFTAENVMKTCQLLEDLIRYSLESRDYGIVEQSLLRIRKLLGDTKLKGIALPQEYLNSQEFMRVVRLSEVYALRSPDIADRDKKKRGLARADMVCNQGVTLAESVEANPQSSEKDRRNLASFYLHRGEIRRYTSQLAQDQESKASKLEQAIKDYIKTIELCETSITRLGTPSSSSEDIIFYKRVRLFGYNNKGLAQQEQNDLDGAVRTYDLAIGFAKDLNDKKYLAQVLINLGAVYYSKNELAACLAMFQRAYQVAKDGHRSSDVVTAGFNTIMTLVIKFLKDSGIKDAKDLDDSTEASLSTALESALGNMVNGKPLQPLQDALRLIKEVRPLAIRRRSSRFVEALTRYESGINYLLKNYN